MDFRGMIPRGVPITVSSHLPFEEVYLACSVETKEEIRIPTGQMIHAMQIGKRMYVSSQLYDDVFSQLPDPQHIVEIDNSHRNYRY